MTVGPGPDSDPSDPTQIRGFESNQKGPDGS